MSADPNQLHVFTVGSQIGHVMHNVVGQADDFDDVNVFQQNASNVQMQVIDATGAGGSLTVCALRSEGAKLYFTRGLGTVGTKRWNSTLSWPAERAEATLFYIRKKQI